MSKGIEARTRLFNKFSDQLLLLKRHGVIDWEFKYERPYLCPICLVEFSENDLKDDPDKNFLTLEDAPPASLGGSKIALTCKKCNSECGHKIDNHLLAVLKYIDASYFYKGSKHFGTVIVDGSRLTVELTAQGDGTFTAYHRIKQNHPTKLEKAMYALKNMTLKPILNFDQPPPNYDPKKVDYALIKANYIVAFAKFGYIFLLKDQYNSIREQIKNPDREYPPYTGFMKNQFPSNFTGTYYVHDPGLQSILNVFTLKTEYSETLIGGFLPLAPISFTEYNNRLHLKSNDIFNLTQYDYDADLFHNFNEIENVLQYISRLT